ncbi:MAG: phosphoribosyltransferase family protein [Steroidobacteraceae bacterium]
MRWPRPSAAPSIGESGSIAAAVRERAVILVDDGLATGASMRAALEALGRQEPRRLIAAVPVAPAGACEALRAEADEVVCAGTPADFTGVSQWYRDFSQTTDEEVRELLARSGHHPSREASGGTGPGSGRGPHMH